MAASERIFGFDLTLVPASAAALPLTDLTIRRGYGAFDFLRETVRRQSPQVRVGPSMGSDGRPFTRNPAQSVPIHESKLRNSRSRTSRPAIGPPHVIHGHEHGHRKVMISQHRPPFGSEVGKPVVKGDSHRVLLGVDLDNVLQGNHGNPTVDEPLDMTTEISR